MAIHNFATNNTLDFIYDKSDQRDNPSVPLNLIGTTGEWLRFSNETQFIELEIKTTPQ